MIILTATQVMMAIIKMMMPAAIPTIMIKELVNIFGLGKSKLGHYKGAWNTLGEILHMHLVNW